MNQLKEDIGSVFARDPAARNWFEVLTCYPGLHAVLIHRITHWLWVRGLKWPARMGSHIGRFLTGIEIHPGARIGRRFFIDHGMGVVIGETAEIGDDCTLYHGVTLGGTSWQQIKRHPTLKDNVVVGAGAKVLGPIVVHDGAHIGSNAVVVRDVPTGATVVGIPGRIAKSAERDRQRQVFEAYGASPNMDDPVASAVENLILHVQALEQEIAALKGQPPAVGSSAALEAAKAAMPEGNVTPHPSSPKASGEGSGTG